MTNNLQSQRTKLLAELAELDKQIEEYPPVITIGHLSVGFDDHKSLSIIDIKDEEGVRIDLAPFLIRELRDYCNQCLDYLEQQEVRGEL